MLEKKKLTIHITVTVTMVQMIAKNKPRRGQKILTDVVSKLLANIAGMYLPLVQEKH